MKENLTIEDFNKAREALRKADVKGDIITYYKGPEGWYPAVGEENDKL